MTRRTLPSLKGLQAFEAFARTRSMTLAAEALNVTHGAVSRQVKALERQLGASLVAGPRHRLELTPAGRTLAAALGAAFDMVAAALPGAAAPSELVLSCQSTFAMKWLIPRLPAFLGRHPGKAVRIVEDNAPADFSRGEAQAAIRLQSEAAAPGVRGLVFLDHAFGPVLSPALSASVGEDPERLLQLPRLRSETFPSGWDQWAAVAGQVLPPVPERVFEHNTYMLEAAAAGLGVAVTARAFAEGDITAGRLVAPWGFQPLPARFVFLTPASARNPLADAFGTWLQEAGGRPDRRPPVAPTPSGA